MASLKYELIRKAEEKVLQFLQIFIILFSLCHIYSCNNESDKQIAKPPTLEDSLVNMDPHYRIIDHRKDTLTQPMIWADKKLYDDTNIKVQINIAKMGKQIKVPQRGGGGYDSINIHYYYYLGNNSSLDYGLSDSFYLYNTKEYTPGYIEWMGNASGNMYTVAVFNGNPVALKYCPDFSKEEEYETTYVKRQTYYSETFSYYYKSSYKKGNDTYYVFYQYNADGTIKDKLELKNIILTIPQLKKYLLENGYDTLQTNVQIVYYSSEKNNVDTITAANDKIW